MTTLITNAHDTPHSAAREILGDGHPQESALVVMLRRVYTDGFNEGWDSGAEGTDGAINQEWEYLGESL